MLCKNAVRIDCCMYIEEGREIPTQVVTRDTCLFQVRADGLNAVHL